MAKLRRCADCGTEKTLSQFRPGESVCWKCRRPGASPPDARLIYRDLLTYSRQSQQMVKAVVERNFTGEVVEVFASLIEDVKGLGPNSCAEIAFALFLALEDCDGRKKP